MKDNMPSAAMATFNVVANGSSFHVESQEPDWCE
jgi:hypothetical protein